MWTLVALASLLAADAPPGAWTVWSDRAETRPVARTDSKVSRGGGESLFVTTATPQSFGGWQRTIDKIEPGAWYRFTAYYKTAGVAHPSWQILPRLDWRADGGRRAGEVDIAYRTTSAGDWTRATLDVQAPDRATSVNLQLFLAHAAGGSVWWDDVSFERIDPPAPRKVTIATINDRPSRKQTVEENLAQFAATVDRGVPARTDLIVLPEGITVVGTGMRYAEVSESVPGRTTTLLGEMARKHRAYVIAGIYERDGDAVYNTAVLIDRQGKLAGKYRKVHLPREEMEQLTPGDSYPVFTTDFGTLGIMICYDVFFAQPAEALASRGAEIVVLPIWGGDETLAKARAIENQIYLVASGYDHPTYIMTPGGERIAQAGERGTAAIATVDLSTSLRQRGNNLGDMRNRMPKERRVDVR